MSAMAEPLKQRSPDRSLLDLPDANVDIAVAKLADPDKQSFMAACRKTALMTMTAAQSTLKVTKNTKFPGIKQVLNSFQTNIQLVVICPPEHAKDNEPSYDKPVTAIAMLMGLAPGDFITKVAANCHWHGITKVTVQATSMKCLLPPFLAIACPNLAQLKLATLRNQAIAADLFTNDAEAAIPMIPCRSLKNLELAVETSLIQLPPAYHSVAELCQSLPNIDTLIMSGDNAGLVKAFPTQLTRLRVESPSHATEQAVRQCSNLEHLSISKLILPGSSCFEDF